MPDYTGQVLRDVLSVKVGDDAADEVLSHDDSSDGLPVRHVLTQQQTYRLQRHLHDGRRVGHTSHLYQLLLLDLFHSCDMQTPNVQYACNTSVIHSSIHTAISTKINKYTIDIHKIKKYLRHIAGNINSSTV